MNSVPVGDTILRAWGFAGRRILPLLGAAWLTTTFYGVALAYLLAKLSNTMLVWPRPDAGSFDNFALFYLFCIVVVTALANAVMAVPMSREALEPGGEWKSAYFSVAFREWLLFANLLLLYVVIIAVVSALVFGGNVGIAVSTPMIGNDGIWRGINWPPIMEGALAAVAIGAGLFLATRFGFFLSTIAVADAPTRLLQAWVFSRGNFWRLLAVGLGLILPLVAVGLLVEWAMFGLEFRAAVTALFSSPHDKLPLFEMIRDHGGAIAAAWAIVLLVLNAIFAGAGAEAFGVVEHGVESVPVREYVSIAEPAFAMAAVSPHVAVTDVKRVEPGFIAEGRTGLAAHAPEELSSPVADISDEENPAMQEAVPSVAKDEDLSTLPVPVNADAPHSEIAEAVAPQTEFAPPVAPVETAAARADASMAEAAAPEVITSIAAHEEPLAPQEAAPAMDPLGHAAPAAPDPSGAPTTPLPSFVRAQPSPGPGSSEAA
jgi:hypothetical protein